MSDTAFDALLSRFLDNACPDHHVRGGSDHDRAQYTAMRLLARHPEIATANFYTAVVCGNVDQITPMLAADPGWATRRNGEASRERSDAGGEGDLVKKDWGPKGWEPLLYLCFTRLPRPAAAENTLAIARALLDAGADPNVYFMAGSSQYTPLVGAIGDGEEGRPPHSTRDALVRLLLERGANPYDIQVVYNIHFSGKAQWFLELAYEHARRSGRLEVWADPEWQMLNAGGYGSGARWFLETAIEHQDEQLVAWCLSHGANPSSPPGTRRGRQRSLHDEAMFRGYVGIAELLATHGATRSSMTLTPLQTLISACVRGDKDAIRSAIEEHPKLLRQSEPLFAAAKCNQRSAAELLLDLGTSPNVESPEGERALHLAAYSDAVDVGQLLIDRGADVDAIGRRYGNTALGGAMHCQSRKMIALLAQHTRSAWEVGYAGFVDRLRELLEEKPERARGYDGETLLMYLPLDDEDKAMEAAGLLLEHGADPTIRDPQGRTAADRAEANGMDRVATLLRRAERTGH